MQDHSLNMIEHEIMAALSLNTSGVYAFAFNPNGGDCCKHFVYPIYGSDGCPTMRFASTLIKPAPTDIAEGDSIPRSTEGIKLTSIGLARSIDWGNGRNVSAEQVRTAVSNAIKELLAA